VRERIGYVSQGFSSAPGMTGRGELAMQSRMYGMDAGAARRRAQEVLDHLGLAEAADRPVRTWSGGMRRRLDVGMGIVHRPPLLFLDEPTTGLDPQARAGLWDEIAALRASGTTVFLTTHYLDEADALCDRLFVIDHGVTVAVGTPDELKRRVSGDVVTLSVNGATEAARPLLAASPVVREITETDGSLRLTVDHGEEALPVLLRTLDGANITMSAISLSRPTLDDVFLTLTGRSLRDDSPGGGGADGAGGEPELASAGATTTGTAGKEF
jgi:ABC-2 type transport system ATP-binding protein